MSYLSTKPKNSGLRDFKYIYASPLITIFICHYYPIPIIATTTEPQQVAAQIKIALPNPNWSSCIATSIPFRDKDTVRRKISPDFCIRSTFSVYSFIIYTFVKIKLNK